MLIAFCIIFGGIYAYPFIMVMRSAIWYPLDIARAARCIIGVYIDDAHAYYDDSHWADASFSYWLSCILLVSVPIVNFLLTLELLETSSNNFFRQWKPLKMFKPKSSTVSQPNNEM